MDKAAEKLIILNTAGQGILERLGFLKKIVTSPTQRPAFIGDTQYTKVMNSLLKKFPEFEPSVDKTPGFELLTGKSKLFFDELEPFYFTFVDAFEFKEKALSVLNEVANGVAHMQLDDNPVLTTAFMSLFTLYAQVNFLISSIEERKAVLAVYYKLFFFIKCTNEPNFARVANYVVSCDNPARSMQEEMRSVTNILSSILVGLIPLYSKLRTISVLRKEGALNITLKPEEMSRPVIDKFHWQMILDPQITLWISFGYLICPEALSTSGAFDLLKMVLSENLVVPITRNTVLPLHSEYENTFASWKSKTFNLSKQKKVPKELIEEFVKKGISKRNEKRIYLRQELNALFSLCSDKPALLGPKFPLVLGGLVMAKEEVMWYFRHVKAPLPKSVKRQDDLIRDKRISELLYLLNSFTSLISRNSVILQNYYTSYLGGADLRRVENLLGSSFQNSVGGPATQTVRSIIEQLRSPSDLAALRLNWSRVEAHLSSRQSPLPLIKVREAAERMFLVVNHSQLVDQIPILLEKCSLKELYYWREILFDSFSKAIKDGPTQPLHAMTYFKIIADFPSNASQFNAQEREEIGTVCVERTGKLLEEMTTRVANLINEVSKQYIVFDSQLQEANAAYPLLIKRKDIKASKDLVAPATPGLESDYRKRTQLERLRLYERNAWQLCTAFNEVESIPIYDQLFTPREFLREKLTETLKKFLRTASIVEIQDEKHSERILQRPSIIESQLRSYISALKLVENFVDLDIGNVINDVLLSEIWIPALGKSNTTDWISVDETQVKYDDKMIGTIVNWYGEFVAKRLSTPGIVFSPNRKGFVSKTGLPFKAELYADIVEMRSLSSLIGPYGVKLIDREILKFILNAVNSMKDYMSHNKNVLEELKHNYLNESQCNDLLKKLRDTDSFTNKAIAIGNALYFREILHNALRDVVEEKTPYIFNTVRACFSQYRRNTFMVPELLPIDMLAMDCGLSVGTADQTLKKFLSKSIGSADAALFDLFPYMFAASFTSNVWKDAVYRPVVEAHVNNAHTLAKTINDLVIAFKAITNNSGNEKEIVSQLESFVEVSSVILLRMARSGRDKHGPVDFPSMIIFMDKFIQASPLLTSQLLEKCLPYALLRSEWRSIYALKSTGKKTERDDPNDVF